MLPQEDYLFYADTLHVPYGEKTKEEVREYILDAVDFIAAQKVKALVIACNTATSIVIDEEKIVPYLEKELSFFDLNQYGTVVLGCTHFPYFENSLRRVFPKDIDFTSGSIGTANHLKRILELKNQVNQGTGDILFFKSGVKVEDTLLLANYRSLFEVLDKLS